MQGLVVFTALLAFAATVQSAATGGIKDKVLAVTKKCVAESKVPEGTLKLAFNQNIPQNEGERCFLECNYRGLNLVQGDKFNLEGALKLVHARFQNTNEAALATKLVETCAKEVIAKPNEKCSFGRTIRECFVNHGKQVNFFPSA